MAKVVAITNIRHGTDKGEVKVFAPGEAVDLDAKAQEQLVASGSAVKVEKAVKVDNSDPTVVRDTVMLMSGNYPSSIDRPAAVGRVPVKVASAEEAERIEQLEEENEQLKVQAGQSAELNQENQKLRAALEAAKKK